MTKKSEKRPQHTPGPWTAKGQVVSCSKGVVVEVESYPDETAEEHEAVRADARLIAAAPDLLAVVKKWIELRDGGPMGLTGAGEWLTRLEAAGRLALAKARGV